jgi:hypothetical protein
MPSDLIQKRFNQLSHLADELHRLGHTATEDQDQPTTTLAKPDPIRPLIESFQRQLNGLRLAVTADLDENITADDGTPMRIGYGRSPRWGLVYRRREKSVWSRPVSLLDAPMDIRLKALPVLPKLLGAVKTASEKALADLRNKP